jgi:cytochrome c oxidase subunit IV
MARRTPATASVTRIYLLAFVLLLFLTAVEASTVLLFHFPPAIRVTILLISALVKATLIGAYYMNLKFERLALVYVATIPLLLGILMFFAIVPDAARVLGLH